MQDTNMSYQNGQLSSHIGILWKTFVKGTSNIQEKSFNKCVHQLGFEGNDAKVAYEEIVNQDSDINSQGPRKRHIKSKTTENLNNLTRRSSTVYVLSKKNQSSEELTGKTAVNTIFKAVEQKDLSFLRKHMTLENVNLADEFGWTPLMTAAYCGHLEVVQFLLSLGANRKAKERSGLTAAQLALKKNYLSIVALLKKKIESVPTLDFCADSVLTASSKVMHSSGEYKDSWRNDVNNVLEETQQNTEFYCDVCKTHFQQTTIRKHEASILHIFNTKPKLPLSMYGISKQNKGYQMLLNNGWEEEGGLGPSGKGMKYPIKTYLKVDRKGVGHPAEKEPRVTHFKPGDINAVSGARIPKQKSLKKRDREKLIHREARNDRALRIALS